MNLVQQLVFEVQHASPSSPPPPTPQATEKLEASLPPFPSKAWFKISLNQCDI
jgi:hypothetical protein